MDLATARRAITDTLEEMRAAYYRPVFDEWAIVALGARHGGIVAYSGFRAAEFVERFQEDMALLRQALASRNVALGDAEFVRHAHGAQHDAGIRIGAGSYLILNNTSKRMAEMSTDPRWEHAQAPLLRLAERFRADPLDEI